MKIPLLQFLVCFYNNIPISSNLQIPKIHRFNNKKKAHAVSSTCALALCVR